MGRISCCFCTVMAMFVAHTTASDLPNLDFQNIAITAKLRNAKGFHTEREEEVMEHLAQSTWQTVHTRFYINFYEALTSKLRSNWQRRTKNKGRAEWRFLIVMEFLIGWLIRLRNENQIVPSSMALSLYLYANMTPKDCMILLGKHVRTA